MKTSKYLKKKIVFFIISMIFISICGIVTFCFMNDNLDDLVYEQDNLKVIYHNGKEGIKASTTPIDYKDGNNLSPSNLIKIINTATYDTGYYVKVTTSNNKGDLDKNKLYVSVNDGEGVLLGKVKEGIIYSKAIHANEEDIIDVKFWVASEYINDEDYHKTLKINVEVREK